MTEPHVVIRLDMSRVKRTWRMRAFDLWWTVIGWPLEKRRMRLNIGVPIVWRTLRPYFAHGRCQVRVGYRWVFDGVDRFRWIGVTWQ